MGVLTALRDAPRWAQIGLALAVVGALLLTGRWILAPRDGKLITPGLLPPQSVAGPVVLIPGYGGATGSLAELAGALEATGRSVTIAELPEQAQGDIRVQAQALDAQIGEILTQSGAPSVDLVGFSAGGVVARQYIREHQGALRVRRLVSLGSPHHGTELADLGAAFGRGGACPTACQQLAQKSELLEFLNSVDETPEGPIYTSIYTQQDETVKPPETAKLLGATNLSVQEICPEHNVSHSGLPTDPVVVSLVLLALGPGIAQEIPSCASLGG